MNVELLFAVPFAVQGWPLDVGKIRQLLGRGQPQQALHHDQLLINACTG